MSSLKEGRARVDAWLWSIRLFPTRTAATEAVTAGRVRVDGVVVRPAFRVGPGVEVEVRRPDRAITVRVVQPIAKRVGAPVAVTCYEVLAEERFGAVRLAGAPLWGVRDRGTGRPTKRDRRDIDRFLGGRR